MNLSPLRSTDTQRKNSPLAGAMQTRGVSKVDTKGTSFSSHIVAAGRQGDTVTISEEGRALAAAMLAAKARADTAA